MSVPIVAEELSEAEARGEQAAAQIDAWTARRDEAIVDMHRAGWSLRHIASTVGLTHTSVRNVLLRAGEL